MGKQVQMAHRSATFPEMAGSQVGRVLARTTKHRLYRVLQSVTINKGFLIGSDEPPQVSDIAAPGFFVL
jgi:hypothetical protein